MSDYDYTVKDTVLKSKMSDDQINTLLEEKKTRPFKTLLGGPKKQDIHLDLLNLKYEEIIYIAVRNTVDFYKKATHSITVPYNVKEVVLGDGIFPIRSKSGLAKTLSGKKAKHKVDIELEEHTFVDDTPSTYFDIHGKETEFSHKLDSASVENYPKKILGDTTSIIKSEITIDEAITILESKLKSEYTDVRDVNEKFTITEVKRIYVPIYEARLIGPKNKVAILRIDAVTKKTL